MDILMMIADERRRVADLVEALTPEQLRTPSLCSGWTVHDVAAHLLAPLVTPTVTVVAAFVRSGLNLHRTNIRMARVVATRSAAEIAAGLRENATNPFRPPVVGYLGPLTDLQVHGQDMRRPLGIAHGLRPERLAMSLTFLVGGRAVGFVPKGLPGPLRFQATDLSWTWGAGPAVRGPAEALLLALTGRGLAVDDLTGDGVAPLRQRLRS